MVSGDIYTDLLQKKRYRIICDSLRKRAQNDPRLLYSYANIPEFTLIWLLSDERSEILSELHCLQLVEKGCEIQRMKSGHFKKTHTRTFL